MDTTSSANEKAGFAWQPVPLRAVTIDDSFWKSRLRVNRERTIPFEYQQCKDTGRVDALRLTWTPGTEPVPHIFWESDIAKWIEAASYSLATHPDDALDRQVDETIALLASAQQPDGYLNTYFTVVKPGQRWTDLRDAHELYCAGHLIEAGVAHFQSTGKRSLLTVVSRYANYINTVFGRKPGQKRGYCGHEEIELALVKLYRATGEARYLHLAQYFVDERGREPYYFEREAAERGTPGYFEQHRAGGRFRTSREYCQSHKPVRDQEEAVGHSVRAMYLYSAMADLAGENGDESLRTACRRLWDHLTSKRMYVTGGLGSAAENEGFTSDYDLPNETAYAETCAATGLVFWAHRMVQLEGDAKYADVLERALYNGVISGVSLDGTRFFYENPLASRGDVTRKEWFGVSCCPPNLARLLASLGQYVYSTSDTTLAVHLYIQSEVKVALDGATVMIRQETDYPWAGSVRLTVSTAPALDFGLRLRVPGWCRDFTAKVNGEQVPLAGHVRSGYLQIDRTWHDGDTVSIEMEMPVERVYAHPQVKADTGCVALQRGPVVYCLEEADNATELLRLAIPRGAAVTAEKREDLLDGVVALQVEGTVVSSDSWNGSLYRNDPPSTNSRALTAIPYYAWDNRERGQMRVWMREVE